MNKKKAVATAAALAALSAGAWAQSSVQLTGTVDAFAGAMQMAGATRTNVLNSGGMTTSQFAFKGTEDLGGGLRAGFTLASYLQLDSGASGRFTGDTLFSQAANVSLSGSFGTVVIGRGQAPNYLPTIFFNPFGDSFTFSPLVLHSEVPLYGKTGLVWNSAVPADAGWNNRILYSTPSLAGLVANVYYQFGEVAGSNGKNNVGANLMYSNGPFAATAFYEKDQVTNPGNSVVFSTNDRKTDWMLGASYDFNVAKAFATYGKASSNILVPTSKTMSLGVSVPVGLGKILADTARTEISPSGATRRTSTVGYDHNLSKRTDAYANVMRDSITGLASGTSWGVGLRHRF